MSILGFRLNSKLFLRDPQITPLGQSMIRSSIEMIYRTGFEEFTFKKLGREIGSPEASVYRYFENKQRLLLYLIDWYWTWLGYCIDLRNQNVQDPRQRLRNCLQILVEEKKSGAEISFVDEQKLQHIVNSEFEKTYLTRQVDVDNRDGLFLPYKGVCGKLAGLIKEISPKYKFPQSLASTVMLSANHQLYYAEHLPSLSDIKKNSGRKSAELAGFLDHLIINAINAKPR